MLYDYQCKECKIEKEVNHGMTEDPKVLCEKCGKEMTRIVTGGTGYIMGKDNIRGGGTTVKRYGNKKHRDSSATPSESAQAKANQLMDGKKMDYDSSNPYKQFME